MAKRPKRNIHWKPSRQRKRQGKIGTIAKRPFAVSMEGLSTHEMEALSTIGVYANPKDATEEESAAFQGTAFMKNENGSYQTSDRECGGYGFDGTTIRLLPVPQRGEGQGYPSAECSFWGKSVRKGSAT